MPAKITAYLVSIAQLLCLAFLYRWRFLHKISLDWLLTLTSQLSTSKLSDNPDERKLSPLRQQPFSGLKKIEKQLNFVPNILLAWSKFMLHQWQPHWLHSLSIINFSNSEEKSLHHNAMVAKFLDDNQPKTSLKKRICTVSNFIDFIQFHLICQMLAKFLS